MFLGRAVTQHKQMSDETAHAIDEEIRHIVDRNYARADGLLEQNMDKLHIMADTLMTYETIDAAQIDAIMEGREPGPPSDWSDDDSTPSASEDGDAKGSDSKDPSDDGSIGGPASLH